MDLESAEQNAEDMEETEETVDSDEKVDNCSLAFVEEHDWHISTNNGNAETYTNNNVKISKIK